MRDTILVAGATGDLGTRIALALRGRGAAVTAPVRPGSAAERLAPLQAAGVNVIPFDLDDEAAVTAACRGVSCVVSALNGLEPVILGTQGVLLRAAVAAGVPRFIPSDFSLDFTKTAPGTNRNLDLRRAFHEVLDRAPIRATSVLNGGFAELLAGPAPFLLFKPRRVLCWGDPDQPLDFTTKDDVAAFTAAVALDPTTPRILRIAGEAVSPRGLAAAAGAVTGARFRILRAGSVGALSVLTRIVKRVQPGGDQVFPVWQGLQYMGDMFGGHGKLTPLDNGRYPDLSWTGVRAVLAGR